jgi:hypothetical protein
MATWAKTPSLAGKFPPKPIIDVLKAIRGVIQTIVAILNVVQAILNVIKVFLLGLTNPLTLIVKALIAILKQILSDLQRAGVYIHGDVYGLKWPFDGSTGGIDLTGGYPTYEARMVRRLTNPNDPDRPIFSNQSQVVGLFLYAQVDGTEIVRIVKFLKQLISLFAELAEENPFPSVTGVEVGYGWSGNTLVNLPLAASVETQNVGRLGIPSIANLSWKVTGSGPLQGITKYAPPVSGFLVEVSVYEGGLIPVYSSPVSSNTDLSGAPFQAYGRYQDIDGNDIRIYGGKDQILPLEVGYNNAVNADGVLPGKRTAYLLRNPSDTTPIPMELLLGSSKHLLQRTFYTKSKAIRALYLNQKFGFRLRAEEMPWECDFEVQGNGKVRVVSGSERLAKNVFVRIRPVANTVTAEDSFKYIFTPVTTNSFAISTVAISDIGPPSPVFQVSFPIEEDVTYISRVQTALQVLTLTRPDLSPVLYGTTGLEVYSRSLLPLMASTLTSTYYKKTDTSRSFRRELRNRSRTVANQVMRSSANLSESYKANIVERTEILDTFKWSDADILLPSKTISETVYDIDSVTGVARNVNAIYDLGRSSQEPARAATLQALRGRNALKIDTSLQSIQARVPVIVNASAEEGGSLTSLVRTGYVRDVRSVLPTEVYEAANTALQASSMPYLSAPGGWIRIRLFTQAIPGLDKVIQALINFLEELDQGLKGIIDAILEYIEFLMARVRELTELLLRLDSWLNFLLTFDVPQVAALFVAPAAGIDGLLSGLRNAENKPKSDGDPAAVYGAGLVFVAGGLPTFILDILKVIFP